MMDSPNPTQREQYSHSTTSSIIPNTLHNQNPSNPQNVAQFIMGNKIGEGTFGIVRMATHILTGEKVAIKILDKSQIRYDTEKKRLDKEISILKLLHHNNIAKLYSVINTNSSLYLIQEYVSGKELLDYVYDKRKLNETEACKYFQQIISGVEYMHKMGVAHRDLKPENLLITFNKEIKIIDFGLSTIYSKGDLLSTACGSPSYAAPEMLRGKKYKGVEIDIWSCGAVLYMMLTGKLAFEDDNNILLFKKIISGRYSLPDFLSRSAQDLIKRMLELNPQKRISIHEIKKHPWFNIIPSGDNVHNGIDVRNIVIPIDDDIISNMEKYDYDKNEVKQNVLLNEYNYITTTYYLLLRKKGRKGEGSIADGRSQLFEEYIKNENNLLKKYNGDVYEVVKERTGLDVRNVNKEKKECEGNEDEGFVIIFKEKEYIKPTKVCRSSSAKHKNRFIKVETVSPGNKKDLLQKKICTFLKKRDTSSKDKNSKLEQTVGTPRVDNTRNLKLLSSNITNTNTHNNSMRSNESFKLNNNSIVTKKHKNKSVINNKDTQIYQRQCKLTKNICNIKNVSDSRNSKNVINKVCKKKVKPLTVQFRCISAGNRPKQNITTLNCNKNNNECNQKIRINKKEINDCGNKNNCIKVKQTKLKLYTGMMSPKDMITSLNITHPSLQVNNKLKKTNSARNIEKEPCECLYKESVFPFSLNCLFDKNGFDMKECIQSILIKQKLKHVYENKGNKFVCEVINYYDHLKFEIKIHQIQECKDACILHFHRIKGNTFEYHNIIKKIFLCLS